MTNASFLKSQAAFICVATLAMLATTLTLATAAPAQTESVLYSFTGSSDGNSPQSNLIFDTAGNLYGTATYGADNHCPDFGGGCGVVFELSPNGTGGWTYTVIHEFLGGTDGGESYTPLTLDSAGNLYGTGSVGGNSTACSGGCGVVYKLAPNGTGGWTYSVIHNFHSTDGANPRTGVVLDSSGNIFGTTYSGGSSGFGVVYRLSPNASGGWNVAVVHNFTGGVDGGSPNAIIVAPSNGSPDVFYGTTYLGGSRGHCISFGCGVVFRLSHVDGAWREGPIHSFTGGKDGGNPSGLTMDGSGNIFVTTAYGGGSGCNHYGCGSVFELSPSGSGYNRSPLYSFTGGSDGGFAFGAPTLDSVGNIFGTTSGGGSAGVGTLFELSLSSGIWSENVLYSFSGTSGDYPFSGVVLDGAGAIYGQTMSGGIPGDCSAILGCGVIYQVTP